MGAEVGGFHDAGTTAGGDHEAAAAGGDLNRPFGAQKSQAASVLVVASHVDGGAGAFQAVFMLKGGNLCVVLFPCGQIVPGSVATLKAGRAEEDHCVLNLLAAKSRERCLIARQ